MSVIFMITDGHKYIKRDINGAYVPVPKSKGDVYDQRQTAKNVLENCINKNLRKRYRVVELDDKSLIKSKNEKPPETDTVKEVNKKREEYNGLFDKWSAEINSLSTFIFDIEKRQSELNTLLSDVDKEICDIEHYIEFKRLNAFEAWNTYTMLKMRLEKRRKIKNELSILTHLLESNISSEMIDKIKEEISNINNKSYTPRKLNALFS